MTDIMTNYYKERADQYEGIYYRDDPARQMEQTLVTNALMEHLAGRSVLEVACGTGYWTQFLARVAKTVTATDINQEVIDIATATKEYPNPTRFQIADAFQLPYEQQSFDGAMANFWFSHLTKDQQAPFLENLHSKLQPGAHVFIADNVYVPGIGGELIRKPGDRNTYKRRSLDGTHHEIVKNYPSRGELFQTFNSFDAEFTDRNIFFGDCFWFVAYQLNPEGGR